MPTAATLLAERQHALDAVMQRLAALDAERQQLLQGALRLEGAVEALRLVTEASDAPDGSTPREGGHGATG